MFVDRLRRRQPIRADAGPDRRVPASLARGGDLLGEACGFGRVGHRADGVDEAAPRAMSASPAAAGRASCMSGATATLTSAGRTLAV